MPVETIVAEDYFGRCAASPVFQAPDQSLEGLLKKACCLFVRVRRRNHVGNEAVDMIFPEFRSDAAEQDGLFDVTAIARPPGLAEQINAIPQEAKKTASDRCCFEYLQERPAF